jgi:FO synthase
MLESTSTALLEQGGAHEGCPDKHPAVRLATIEAAGRAAVPYTSGALCGTGSLILIDDRAGCCLGCLPTTVYVWPRLWLAGILVGIGDTRRDRLHALACLRDLHERFGHIQVRLCATGRTSTCSKARLQRCQALCTHPTSMGHVLAAQEVIVQNFRAKPGTAMEQAPEPPLEELLWAVAAARVVFGPDMGVQVGCAIASVVVLVALAMCKARCSFA